jgi:hypothetical protein
MILAYQNIPKAWKSANKFINYSKKIIFPKGFLLNGVKKVVFYLTLWGPLKNVKTIAVHIQAQDYPYMSKNRLKSRWTNLKNALLLRKFCILKFYKYYPAL